jgi:hypothetical protein
LNKLGNIQDLKRHFIPSHISGHGAHTLLTGGNNRLGAGLDDFFYFLFGDFLGQLGVDHLQVAPTSAAPAGLTIFGEFHQFYARDGLNQFSRLIKYTRPPPQVTGIVVGNGQIQLPERNPAFLNLVQQVLGAVKNIKFRRIILPPHLITGRTGKHNLASPFGANGRHVMIDEFLNHIL